MALPSGVHLVSVLDDTNFNSLSSSASDNAITTSDNMPRVPLLPLECNETLDAEMDIDVDVFRPSAMLDLPLSDAFSASVEPLFGSSFQPELVDAEEDIEQMLLYGSEEALALQSHHQHQTAPGQGCKCRNFAIRASHVQAHEEKVVAKSMVSKDQKRVLRHTFGMGKRLLDFGFGDGAVLDQTQQQHVKMEVEHCTPATAPDLKHEVLIGPTRPLEVSKPVLSVKEEVPSSPERNSRSLVEMQAFDSPMSTVSSPLSTTNFVSLESRVTTPMSTTSRCIVHADMPGMMRSLSPADELEKMTSSGSKTSIAKMNMLTGNFQVSRGHEFVPLVKPTALLPPPYLRGALESPKKRRAHSKTFHSFAQSLSFSFSNKVSTNR